MTNDMYMRYDKHEHQRQRQADILVLLLPTSTQPAHQLVLTSYVP